MAFVIADRVRETSTTTGTGNFTLAGAVTGYQTFDAALDTGDTTYYAIADQGGANWEVGIGTFTSPSTLARTTILSSSNGGSVVTFGAGTKDVFISLPASKTNVEDQPNLIEVNSSSAALRITQTGAGNALVVEDSVNPDSTPFVINASGSVIVGTTASQNASYRLQSIGTNGGDLLTQRWAGASSGGSFIRVQKSRGASIGTNGIVASGDTIGTLSFDGDDGTGFIQAAFIAGAVDGTPGTNDMPGRLVFSTTADGASSSTERMRIDSSGNVGIGTASPDALLTVNTVASFGAGAVGAPSIAAKGDLNTGIYFSAADTLDFSTAGTQRGQFDSSGNFKFNSGYGSVATAYGCRAWVNFDGTGTPSIRASGNVTSITDNGNGDYTVNFTNAMPDANYAVTATVRRDETSTNNSAYASVRNVASAAVAGSVRMFTVLPATPATGIDVQAFSVAIFR